jgi:folate-binding protein YgfZ
LCQNDRVFSRPHQIQPAQTKRLSVPDFTALDDVRILSFSGPDRATFLQGQLTQDTALARPDSTVLSGLADARGRLLFAGHFFVLGAGSDAALALLVPESLAGSLLKRMQMYVLRAKVQVAISGLAVYGLHAAGKTGAAGGSGQQLALAHDPGRSLLLSMDHDLATADGNQQRLHDWLLADIRAGIPAIAPATSGEFIPQMLNLDLLDAISFSKGCYTGQEIIARTKYLGRVKRRMFRFATASSPPLPGTPVHAGRGIVGQVVSAAPTAAGSELLAVITMDDLPGPLFLADDGSGKLERLDLPCDLPA